MINKTVDLIIALKDDVREYMGSEMERLYTERHGVDPIQQISELEDQITKDGSLLGSTTDEIIALKDFESMVASIPERIPDDTQITIYLVQFLMVHDDLAGLSYHMDGGRGKIIKEYIHDDVVK